MGIGGAGAYGTINHMSHGKTPPFSALNALGPGQHAPKTMIFGAFGQCLGQYFANSCTKSPRCRPSRLRYCISQYAPFSWRVVVSVHRPGGGIWCKSGPKIMTATHRRPVLTWGRSDWVSRASRALLGSHRLAFQRRGASCSDYCIVTRGFVQGRTKRLRGIMAVTGSVLHRFMHRVAAPPS